MQRINPAPRMPGPDCPRGTSARRLAWWLCAFVAGMLSTGCLAVFEQPTSRPVPAAQSRAAFSSPAQDVAGHGAGGPGTSAAAADPLAPGFLYFVIADKADRYDGGWRIQLAEAASQEGFMPSLSSALRAGMHLKAQLWPDSYRVRVLAEKPHYDGWVQVDAGAASVLRVDPSSGKVEVLRGSEAASLLAQLGRPARELRLRQTYQPLRIAMHAGLEGRYYGPRRGGQPAGRGQLDLFQGPDRVATVDEAAVDAQGEFTGRPVFVDGRKVDGALARDNGLEDGAAMEYRDGRVFTGRYEGLEPLEGTMRYPDGSAWTGAFEEGEPVGEGRLELADGTVIEQAPGPGAGTLDGAYDCITPKGRKTQCLYFEGERIVSKADYARRVEARRRARAQAEQPPPPPAGQDAGAQPGPKTPDEAGAATPAPPPAASGHPPPPPAPAQAAPEPPQAPAMTQSGSGCGRVNGAYATSTGLSKLTFDGRGRGHLWQHTYGGARSYTFDIDFRYGGSHDSMRFEYEEGIYRDAGGRVLSRQAMPGGSASCSYDGRLLIIGGTKYFKQ